MAGRLRGGRVLVASLGYDRWNRSDSLADEVLVASGGGCHGPADDRAVGDGSGLRDRARRGTATRLIDAASRTGPPASLAVPAGTDDGHLVAAMGVVDAAAVIEVASVVGSRLVVSVA